MIKKCFWMFFVFFFFLFTSNAASICDYSEQVVLNHIASTVKANYEIRTIWKDANGNIVEENEEIKKNALYTSSSKVYVTFLNIQEEIYITVQNDKDFSRTYYYNDTSEGIIEIDGGNLSSIINYTVSIYSNSDHCRGELLRTLAFVTPMYNSYSEQPECVYIPNFDYCKKYVTTPMVVSSDEIKSSTSDAYSRYLNSLPHDKNEEEQINIINKLILLFQTYKVYFILAICIILLVVIIILFVIIKKRKKRIL